MPREQFNARLSKLTHLQIEELSERYELNKTEVVAIAIDRLYQELHPRTTKTIENEPRK